jgi:hypothetical protein
MKGPAAQSRSFGGLRHREYTRHGMGTPGTHPYPEDDVPHLRTSHELTNPHERLQQEPLKSVTRSARPCPRCGSGRLDEMGQSSVKNATSILRCRVCGHVWMIRNKALPVVAEADASSHRPSASRDDQSDHERSRRDRSLSWLRRIWHQGLFRWFDSDKAS